MSSSDYSPPSPESRFIEPSHYQYIAKLIIEDSLLGIILIDSDLNIVAVNPRFCEIYGEEVNQIVGRPLLDTINGDDAESSKKLVEQCLSDGRSCCSFEQVYHHKSSQFVAAEITLVVDSAIDASVNFAVATVEDITHQRDAQLKLSERFDDIQHLERERILSEVASGIAHEINQPLTAISAYAQSCLRLMEQGNPDPQKMRMALDKLSEQVLRAGSITEKVREFAQPRPARKELCNCSELADIARRFILTNTSTKNLVVRSALAVNLPLVNCDPLHVLLVIVCLMRNALDAVKSTTQTEDHEIHLATGQLGNKDVYISVSDSGTGVQQIIEDELFLPFTSTKLNSIGLGLTVSQSIADSQGGKLSYINNASGGATFSLILSVPETS